MFSVDLAMKKGCQSLSQHTSGYTAEMLQQSLYSAANATARQTGLLDGLGFYHQLQNDFSLNESYSFNQLTRDWGDIFLPAPDEVGKVISAIPLDIRVCIASNTEPLHWPYIERLEAARLVIDRPGCAVFKSYEIGYEKPAKDFFKHILSELKVDAGQVLFIDDIGLNVDAFRLLGGKAEVFDVTKNQPARLAAILGEYSVL